MEYVGGVDSFSACALGWSCLMLVITPDRVGNRVTAYMYKTRQEALQEWRRERLLRNESLGYLVFNKFSITKKRRRAASKSRVV